MNYTFLLWVLMSSLPQVESYRIEYVNFSNDFNAIYKSKNIVYANSEKSISYTLPNDFIGEGMFIQNVQNGVRSNASFSKYDTIKRIVYKNFKKDSLFFEAPFDFFYKEFKTFSDSLHSFKWTLVDETKKIGEINCKKAVMSFRGRSYVAWYSMQYPIGNGPWKFGGLPGLIIEISDSEKEVYWRIKSIKLVNFEFPDFPILTDGNFYDYKVDFKNKFLKFQKALQATDNISDPNCSSCGSTRIVKSITPEKLAE